MDYIQVARDTIKRIGYDNTEYGIDYRGCAVLVAYDKQNQRHRPGRGPCVRRPPEHRRGDQGLMFGYACDETPELMPAPIYYAHRVVERQAQLRKDGRLPFLRPDAKSQITMRYVDGKPHSIDTVVLSTQHSPDQSGNRHQDEGQLLRGHASKKSSNPCCPRNGCRTPSAPDQPHRPLRHRRPAG